VREQTPILRPRRRLDGWLTLPLDVPAFLDKWRCSGGAELSNSQSFLSEVCDLLGVPRPDAAKPELRENAYVFERWVTFDNADGTTSNGRIDLYKRGCLVLESKQGVLREEREREALIERQGRRKRGVGERGSIRWDEAMLRAKAQAESYARALPPDEGRPPFVIVVDVGFTIELYSEFSRTGGAYVPFPDPQSHRLSIDDLAREEVRERLRAVWTDPMSLDPARRSARVTREVAERLARLAKSLEASGHSPEDVAHFLMRCLFTMFAEDVGLLPERSFTELLDTLRQAPEKFQPMAKELWASMKEGGFSVALRAKVLHFNGGLFEDASALPLNEDQVTLLLQASQSDWRDVEPAIFGTLLERALDPEDRHKLGAHFTPRAYVERLVIPTIVEPLRDDWAAVQAAATTLMRQGRPAAAAEEVEAFHRKLCHVRVLDPACGSGNFLYVALEHLKRLEGEVLNTLRDLGQSQRLLDLAGVTVGPHQFLGIEVNPRATAIAELVLWIGYLQWHFRSRGNVMPPEPVISAGGNIECRDAVLEWDAEEPVLDDSGEPVTRWDGRTTKTHPVTGDQVPDDTARVPVVRYINPRKATWPEADFVVGNPPFIGNWRMRQALGDGYAEAVRAAHPDVPDSCDYVMNWWDRAADLTREGHLRRFGLITTNSLRQAFARRVIERHLAAKPPLSLAFCVPDHPWVDSADGAAVRIAMTTGVVGDQLGELSTVATEVRGGDGTASVLLDVHRGHLNADLTIGANVSSAVTIAANDGLSCPGVKLHGSGFIVTPEQAVALGLGRVAGLERHIRLYRNGRDLAAVPRRVMVVDLFGLAEDEVRHRFPEVYQWVLQHVKPERDVNKRESRRRNWWVFGEPISTFRPALNSVRRYISTPETAKHRFFVFLDAEILPDNKLVNVALDDAYFLGALSSRVHVGWTLAAGGRLGVGNDPVYVKTRCFDCFPFPDATEEQRARIRELGERLDAHRKRQQELHPKLTMTDMYNVLETLRSGEALTDKERVVHEQGLVSVLKEIHDALDAAVLDAYGWPGDISDEGILERLVALNHERAAEERRGIIRWLRPEFQAPDATRQTDMDIEEAEERPSSAPVAAPAFPRKLAERVAAVRAALSSLGSAATAEEVAATFKRANADDIAEILETLATLGQARELPDGRFVGV